MIWHVFAASSRLLGQIDPDTRRGITHWHVMVRYDPSIGGGVYYYAPLIFGWLGWLSDRIDTCWQKVSSPVLEWMVGHRVIELDEGIMIPRKWSLIYSPFGMLNYWAFNTDRWWCREV